MVSLDAECSVEDELSFRTDQTNSKTDVSHLAPQIKSEHTTIISKPQSSLKQVLQPHLPFVKKNDPEVFHSIDDVEAEADTATRYVDCSPLDESHGLAKKGDEVGSSSKFSQGSFTTLPPVTASKVRPSRLYDSPRPLKSSARIIFRIAEPEDYEKGFPAILSQLTSLGEVTKEQYEARLHELSLLNAQGGFLFWIIVGEDVDTGRIATCATLLVEPKFIHKCGSVAHVEDVVVDIEYRKLRLGQKILDILIGIAKEQQCYKIILDCNQENIPFYSSLGFKENSVHMAMYLE